jgi:hypothetical protein
MFVIIRRVAIYLAAALLIFMACEGIVEACPTCKESLAQNDPAHANMVRGYFWSILFMMSMPFLILGGLSALFWWEVRKAKLAKVTANVSMTDLKIDSQSGHKEIVEV